MKRSLPAVLLVFALISTLNAWAYSDAQIQQMVQSRLMDRTPTDTPAWWQGLGANATQVIIGIYNGEVNTFHRIRLLQGLGWLGDPVAEAFVKQQAQDTELDTLRNAAIRAIARGQGAKDADWVAQWLRDDDAQTRLAAAESLRDMKDAHARELYSGYVGQEKTPWLVAKLKNGPVSVGSLKAVASSEDRPSPDFEGTWRGFWVAPSEGAKGMQSSAVVLELKPTGMDSLGFGGKLLVLKKGNIARTFILAKASARSVNVGGELHEQIAPAGNGAAKIARVPLQYTFQGALTRMGETLLLEVRVPERGSVLVLRKD